MTSEIDTAQIREILMQIMAIVERRNPEFLGKRELIVNRALGALVGRQWSRSCAIEFLIAAANDAKRGILA